MLTIGITGRKCWKMLKNLINKLNITKTNLVFLSILLIIWLICPEILAYRVFDNLISLYDLVLCFLFNLTIFHIYDCISRK